MKSRRAQLFMIEVVVSVSVMVILVTALFAFQNITPPPTASDDLSNDLETAVLALKETRILYEYFDAAKEAYLNNEILLATNDFELNIVRAIEGSVQDVVSFTIKLYYNDNGFVLIDIANEVPIPGSTSLTSYELYSPGHYSDTYGYTTDNYRFLVIGWYEVGA